MQKSKTYVFFYDCITRDELLGRLRSDKTKCILVDTIGTSRRNRHRIKGAATIPFHELIDRKNELHSYDEIILYSKNKSCNAARQRAVGLQIIGFKNIKVYDSGLDEWLAHGLSVEEI